MPTDPSAARGPRPFWGREAVQDSEGLFAHDAVEPGLFSARASAVVGSVSRKIRASLVGLDVRRLRRSHAETDPAQNRSELTVNSSSVRRASVEERWRRLRVSDQTPSLIPLPKQMRLQSRVELELG